MHVLFAKEDVSRFVCSYGTPFVRNERSLRSRVLANSLKEKEEIEFERFCADKYGNGGILHRGITCINVNHNTRQFSPFSLQF